MFMLVHPQSSLLIGVQSIMVSNVPPPEALPPLSVLRGPSYVTPRNRPALLPWMDKFHVFRASPGDEEVGGERAPQP